jgi:hypothetical protein
MTSWEIQGRELINCNCSYGCPCQFNASPTKGFCEAVGWFLIEKGHYGDVRLDGLAFGMALKWPGPIHEGQGKCQPFLDARADEAQREALLKIMSGQDTDPFATVFAVFATTFEMVHEPIFASFDLAIDVEARKGRVRFADIAATQAEPIRNPITGAEHRVRIDLPHGFEYELAEIGSGTSAASGNVQISLDDSYAQLAYIHMNNHGLVRHRPRAA